DNITAAIPLVVDGTADPGSNVKIYDGPVTGTPIDQFTQSPTSNKFQRSLNLAVGTHSLTVVASDNYGDSATSAAVSITVDINGQFTGQFWVTQLQLGSTEEKVLSAILGSPEYFNRSPIIIGTPGTVPSNQTFVAALYAQLLTHTPGSAEINYWVSQIPNVGRAGVAYFLLLSSEHRVAVIGSYYQSLLKRQGSAADISAWDKSGLDLGFIRILFESS